MDVFELSSEGKEFVKKELGRYEDKHSAIIPSLYRAQRENGGYITPDVISHLSQQLQIPEARINEVFQFYTMFNQKTVGKYHVQVCCNISCHMNGAKNLFDTLCREFGVKEGEVTSDGRYSFSRVECLGSCDTAPMMQVNDDYHENLSVESAIQLLKKMP